MRQSGKVVSELIHIEIIKGLFLDKYLGGKSPGKWQKHWKSQGILWEKISVNPGWCSLIDLSLQWRIEDFPEEGALTPKGGAPTYYLANFCRKLHENEEI